MNLTFECGACHTPYRLDQDQITVGGVKITCPKCNTFFFLKKGSTATEEPIVERVIRDGAYEVKVPPPKSNELTADQLFADMEIKTPMPAIIVEEPPPPPPPKKQAVRVTVGPVVPRAEDPVTQADLGDYPPERPPETFLDSYLVPGSFAVIIVVGVLILNYVRVVEIPGLAMFRAPTPIPTATVVPEVQQSGTPRYGFPSFSETPGAVPTAPASPTK
ncbi:MAG: zinc-ribbon domain-containing protein [Pseudomonadota bacterium]